MQSYAVTYTIIVMMRKETSTQNAGEEAQLTSDVAPGRAEEWVRENWEAIQSSNAYVEKHGLPLAKYREFWHGPA